MYIPVKRKFILIAFVLLTNLVAVDAYARRAVSCPIKGSTDFVYYSGSGATSVSQSWMVHFLDWWKAQDPAIDYMDLSAAEIAACDLSSYPELDMYIQPGGDAYLAQKWIGASGKARINDFLDNGGSFSAGVKRMGAGTPSYMEHEINLSGYSTATLEYARKLVGLDAGDDFRRLLGGQCENLC